MTGIPMEKLIKPMLPFMGVLTAALVLIAFFPQIITGPMQLLGHIV